MSDENTSTDVVSEYDNLSESALYTLQDTIDTFLATADVDAVFGEPFVKDETVIIPAAEIVAGFGFGVGSGAANSNEDQATGSGSGGGGGGKIFSRPVAVIISSTEGVRIEPVVDLTKIALAGLTAGAFMLATLLRIKKFKNISEDI